MTLIIITPKFILADRMSTYRDSSIGENKLPVIDVNGKLTCFPLIGSDDSNLAWVSLYTKSKGDVHTLSEAMSSLKDAEDYHGIAVPFKGDVVISTFGHTYAIPDGLRPEPVAYGSGADMFNYHYSQHKNLSRAFLDTLSSCYHVGYGFSILHRKDFKVSQYDSDANCTDLNEENFSPYLTNENKKYNYCLVKTVENWRTGKMLEKHILKETSDPSELPTPTSHVAGNILTKIFIESYFDGNQV